MSSIKTALYLLKNDRRSFFISLAQKFSKCKISHLISDRAYLRFQYRMHFGKKLNLKKPQTYNEKLQWLKLYNRKNEYCQLVDKYEVKKIVAERIGEQYIIPTLGVWENFDDIDFDQLPQQFVLKCTHDSGSVVICKDKKTFDIDAARKKIERKLKSNLFWHGREWPYKNVHPRIMAEKYMEDERTAELRDYKFFCFDGEVKMLFVATDRQTKGEEVKFDFFDPYFHHINIRQGHPNAQKCPDKPQCFDKMKQLSSKLAEGLPHVRVDFYEVNGAVYFGELTFFHFCGLVPFAPEKWDEMMGTWIRLPQKNSI